MLDALKIAQILRPFPHTSRCWAEYIERAASLDERGIAGVQAGVSAQKNRRNVEHLVGHPVPVAGAAEQRRAGVEKTEP